MTDLVERVARATVADIGNGEKLNTANQHKRLMTVQLSSADFLAMARAAIAEIEKTHTLTPKTDHIAHGGKVR